MIGRMKISLNVITTLIFLVKEVFGSGCGGSFEKKGKILHPTSNDGFLLTSTGNTVDCASRCWRREQCWSFYHNPTDQACFLASRYQTVVPDTSHSDTAQNYFDLYRKPGGYSTCKELQLANSNATDSDYWLYPAASHVHYNIVKVYCYDMGTSNPQEYISLPTPNTGEYPNETYQKCVTHVFTLTGCPGNQGIYTYSKIKIDLSTMHVNRATRTFMTVSGKPRDYAWVGDCYTELDNSYTCGPKGSFTINTDGTGLIVDPALTWKKSGYKAKVEMTKSQGGAVINLLCGGYPGSCAPLYQMTLHINIANNASPESAIWMT
ncbi:A disintegrin and metalloproteinase with thrombospondin motifs 20-like [Haliotis cracherodii]|uniref:A disintegrin and metalloproteinase with thrombospondin motifs 20-like n=1 Tax=Haliotis cracherodii TaxID=6455 RepID=UPI0039E90852